jgi:hypothetical protein
MDDLADLSGAAENPHLRRANFMADLLDDAVELPVIGGVGLDPLIGLLPVAGDLVAAICSLYIVAEGYLAGASKGVVVRMLLNVVVDLLIGSIPVVGDAFDVVFRANRRNVNLLARHLDATDVVDTA